MTKKHRTVPPGIQYRLWQVVRGKRRFLITTHSRPDGDAIGSTIALALFLTSLGKEVMLVLEEPLEKKYSFLPFASRVIVWREDVPPPSYDVAFVLDSGDISRVGKVRSWLTMPMIVNIDHHKDNTLFGTVNWVDPLASSVGEMLLRWIKRPRSSEMAQALFLSMATDTGFFRFSNATAEVYEGAAQLLRHGASPTLVYEHIYQNRPYGFLLLLERLLGHLELHAEGRLAISYLSFEDMEEARCHDTEGLLEYMALPEGVEVYILLKEREKHTLSISFRTKGKQDMTLLAKKFGGGGHTQASGCSVQGDVHQWKTTILEAAMDLFFH